jgi:hypothetical protein
MPRRDEPRFVPTGAIASFLVLIVFYAVFWLALYLLMAARG